MSRIFDRLGWGLAGALGLAVVALIAGVVSAGPLTPPGPPAATQETLIHQPANCAAFPIAITAGANRSYKLASDIVMPAACAKDGITVSTNGVTIDLNGFVLQGVVGSLDGIDTAVGAFDLTVKNGVVRTWGESGIDSADAVSTQIDSVASVSNGAEGFLLSLGSQLRNCEARGNGTQGISVAATSTIDDCVAESNGLEGIILGNFLFPALQGGTITNCVANANGASGIAVLVAGATVRGCTSTSNNGHNIFVGDGADVRDNTVVSDVSSIDGIHMSGNNNHVEGNDVRGNVAPDIAYRIAPGRTGNVVIHNVASGGAGAYSVVAGNFLGAVVASEAAMNAAANSNSNIATP